MRSYDASFVQIAPDFPRSRALPPSLPYGQGWVSVSALSRTFEASLVVHTLRVAENEILKLDLPAKRH
jgi:hypothetical protein